MVVETEVCFFSECKIYPGHGVKFIKRDGGAVFLSGSKSKRLFNQGIKQSKLTWTMAWRRLHKKDKKEESQTQRKRRIVRVQRAYVGLTAEDLAKKRSEPPKVRAAAREAAMKEAKERATKEKAARQAAQKKGGNAAPQQKISKSQHESKGR